MSRNAASRHSRTMVGTILLCASILAAGAARSQSLSIPASAPASGAALFSRQCGTCHSDKPGEARVGPSLYHVVGRTAGQVPGFAYSDALKRSGIKWDAASLDKWLTDTSADVPGSMMNFRESDPAKRKAIIAYLTSISK